LRVLTDLTEFFGAGPLSLFTLTVFSYWMMVVTEEGYEGLGAQFLLLPIFYVPFRLVADALTQWHFDASMLYVHPLVVIPAGYLYLFPWLVFLWVFGKLRLVIE